MHCPSILPSWLPEGVLKHNETLHVLWLHTKSKISWQCFDERGLQLIRPGPLQYVNMALLVLMLGMLFWLFALFCWEQKSMVCCFQISSWGPLFVALTVQWQNGQWSVNSQLFTMIKCGRKDASIWVRAFPTYLQHQHYSWVTVLFPFRFLQ